MKKGQIKFLSIVAITVILLVSSQSFAQTPTPSPSPLSQPPDNQTFFNTSFWQNITVAILSAVLAFLSGYALAGIGKRQGSGKKLSYSLDIQKGLVQVEKNVKEKVKVLYAGEEISNEDLYHINCDIENTGATVVKSQEIRFSFSEKVRILDSSLEPAPQPEMKVESVHEPTLEAYERKYRIGHIERGQSVGFSFVVTSKEDIDLRLYPFNQDGDVEFNSKSVNKVADEQEKIAKFLALLIMYFVVPQAVYIIYSQFLSNVIAAVIRLVILLFLVPLIVPFSKAISNIIAILAVKKEESPKSKYTVSIETVETGGNIAIGDAFHKP